MFWFILIVLCVVVIGIAYILTVRSKLISTAIEIPETIYTNRMTFNVTDRHRLVLEPPTNFIVLNNILAYDESLVITSKSIWYHFRDENRTLFKAINDARHSLWKRICFNRHGFTYSDMGGLSVTIGGNGIKIGCSFMPWSEYDKLLENKTVKLLGIDESYS